MRRHRGLGNVTCRECGTVTYSKKGMIPHPFNHTKECSQHPSKHRLSNAIAYILGALFWITVLILLPLKGLL